MDFAPTLPIGLLVGSPSGPTLLGVDVILVATVLAGVAAMAVMLAIYAAITVRDPMSKSCGCLGWHSAMCGSG